MHNDFKEIIFNLFADDPGRYRLQKRSIDYDKAITHGALGETGDNYFFLLYKDAFEKQPKYAAVYFLHTPFNISRPFETGFKGDPHLRERWSFYMKTAVYFLKKNYNNTMMPTGSNELESLYDEMKQLVETHIKEETKKKENFETYNFDLLKHGFQAEPSPPPPPPHPRRPHK
ncbi:MAG: hypothetical protein GY950_00910, partial [bacterium]|nr:hypothetical protein [bacterium]